MTVETFPAPAKGSAERAAFDQLDDAERSAWNLWMAARQGEAEDGAASAALDDLPVDRQRLVLAALGYGPRSQSTLMGLR